VLDLIVSGGRVFAEDGVVIADVAVRGETIVEVAPRITQPARRRIDATGLAVLPGLVDPHVHLGLPAAATVSCDDVASGTRAALFGGVTTVIDFSLQRPGEGLADAAERRAEEFAGRSFCDFAVHANMTSFGPDFAARLPDELDRLAGMGCTSLKVFTTYARRGMMIPPEQLPTVLRAAAARGLVVLVHAEDDSIVNAATDRLLAAGHTTARDFPTSRPAAAEAAAVTAVTAAAIEAGATLYVVHVSTAGGLAAVEAARGRIAAGSQARILAETCPQYVVLTHERYTGADAHRFVVTPPLRSPADRDALRGSLSAFDTIATDHCPFMTADTDRPDAPFTELPSGLPGIETRLPILWTLAARDHLLTEERVVELLATRPAEIFGLAPRKGAIRSGADADLVLLDPAARWTIRASDLHSRCDHSPYEGMEVQGRVRTVLLRGDAVVDAGVSASDPRGRHLPRVAD